MGVSQRARKTIKRQEEEENEAAAAATQAALATATATAAETTLAQADKQAYQITKCERKSASGVRVGGEGAAGGVAGCRAPRRIRTKFCAWAQLCCFCYCRVFYLRIYLY